MAQLGTTDAAEIAGVSKNTIIRAIKSGKLTATRDETNAYQIDPSELSRVFTVSVGDVGSTNVTPPGVPMEQSGTPADIAALMAEVKELHEREMRSKVAEIERMSDQISDLRQDRDDWKTQASNQTLLLKDERDRHQPKPGFFTKLSRAMA